MPLHAIIYNMAIDPNYPMVRIALDDYISVTSDPAPPSSEISKSMVVKHSSSLLLAQPSNSLVQEQPVLDTQLSAQLSPMPRWL